MENYSKYWIASLLRGVIAICAGMAVLILPQMISLVLLLPFAILISMMCLAAYGMIDSVLLLNANFLLPRHDRGRLALRVQGMVGILVGIALFFFVYGQSQLRWFLYLAAFQAATTAATEFTVARGTSARHGSRWCFAGAIVAAISAVVLVAARNLDATNVAWIIFGYLGVFGFTLSTLSARMLFAERPDATNRIHAVLGPSGAPLDATAVALR